jgi:antitoxin component YwqK of YwqJK toxin-antitoxin module
VLLSEFNYKNGKLDGPEITYAKNGGISSIDTYKNGQKINRRSYNKIGELEFDQDYPYMEEE